MADRLRVVFDTNVYIAAAINPAGPAAGWLAIAAGEPRSFDLFTSDAVLAELGAKLSQKFQLPAEKIEYFLASTKETATVVKPTQSVRVVEFDPDDDVLFECALAGPGSPHCLI